MRALVVDGYNAIYKIPQLRKLLDSSLMEARRAITDMAKAYAKKIGGFGKITVVFDGRDEYANLGYTHQNQVFSKTGKGDAEVVKTINTLSEKYDVLVVTDDNYVRNSSRSHGASMIKVAEFYEVIGKTKVKKSCRNQAHSDKISHQDANKINSELKKYWNIEG